MYQIQLTKLNRSVERRLINLTSLLKLQASRALKLALSSMLAISPVMVLAGCSSNAGNEVSSNDKDFDFSNAQALLLAIWEKENDDDKPMIIGGVGDNVSETEPLALDLSAEEMLKSTLVVPESLIKNSVDGASVMNGIMANAFTASAWQLKEGADSAALIDEIEKTIKDNHWVCTFPDQYDIFLQDNFVVVSFGQQGQIEPFVTAVKQVMTKAETFSGKLAE